jgi:four helix bundle protein
MTERIKEFTDLKTWQKAHQLVLEIYRITSKFPKAETYGLVSQLRRAAISTTANIAEGFSRWHYGERIKFYYNARGSLAEVQSFLITARDLKFIDKKLFDKVFKLSKDVELVLSGLIRATKKRKES